MTPGVRRMNFKTLRLVAAIVLSTASATVANAEDAKTRQVVVAGLNLRSPAGVAVLRQRVSFAIKGVCGSADLRDLDGWMAMTHCRQETAARVSPEVDALVAAAGAPVYAALSVTR